MSPRRAGLAALAFLSIVPAASAARPVVAVLDTGAQLDRAALAGRLWTNPGEVPGDGIDNDGDGFADDVHGWDFANDDAAPDDDDGHGTHVAGIVTATGAATVLPVKVLDAGNAGTAHWLAQGVRYAVDRGARILNISVNGDGASSELVAAIAYAREHGAVLVASAGNDGRDLAREPSYPVSYDDPAVLGVGAGAAFSNHGPGVDVLAPGQHVLSLGFPAGYAYRSGTSMSAAVVSRTLAAEAVADPLAPVPALGDALVATSIDGVVDATAAVAAVRRHR